MDLTLNKNNPIPIGVQVKEQIKILIYSGSYRNGDKLPSICELAGLLGVNKNTIVTALKDLQKDGYVESYRGKGVFIKHKKTNILYDDTFLNRIDSIIQEAKKKNIGVNELINLISSKFDNVQLYRKVRALFLMGISQQLVDANVNKLRNSISGVEFESLFVSKKLDEEKFLKAVNNSDLILIPSILFDFIKERIPGSKPLIKTTPNLKTLDALKKSMEKKKVKVAVIGGNASGAQTLAGMFVSAGLFKPKLVVSLDNLEKCKKELKDMDSLVVCLSAKEEVEKLKIKEKEIYYFSDYINETSIREIKMFIKKLSM